MHLAEQLHARAYISATEHASARSRIAADSSVTLPARSVKTLQIIMVFTSRGLILSTRTCTTHKFVSPAAPAVHETCGAQWAHSFEHIKADRDASTGTAIPEQYISSER